MLACFPHFISENTLRSRALAENKTEKAPLSLPIPYQYHVWKSKGVKTLFKIFRFYNGLRTQ